MYHLLKHAMNMLSRAVEPHPGGSYAWLQFVNNKLHSIKPKSGGSYASAVRLDKPKYTSISTQTDIQWVKDQAIVKNTEEVRTITPTG